MIVVNWWGNIGIIDAKFKNNNNQSFGRFRFIQYIHNDAIDCETGFLLHYFYNVYMADNGDKDTFINLRMKPGMYKNSPPLQLGVAHVFKRILTMLHK